MRNIELRDQSPPTPFEAEEINKKPRNRLVKKTGSVSEVPRELRKKEAAEPLYLVRYE